MERFVAILIEHCAGQFPLWLSPTQFTILPISEKYREYADALALQLAELDIRGTVDHRDEKIGRKIRDAEMKKIPYMLIVGEKEQENTEVAVRKKGEGDLGSLSVNAFIDRFKEEVSSYA
jgi:threonyl-tRNA synthetase